MNFDPDHDLTAAEHFDHARSAHALAVMTPLWQPGRAVMYHFITFGTLAAELIRRVDGRGIGQFVAEEIAAPLGVDLWIGLPEAEEPRRAPHSSQDAGGRRRGLGEAARRRRLRSERPADPRLPVGRGHG